MWLTFPATQTPNGVVVGRYPLGRQSPARLPEAIAFARGADCGRVEIKIVGGNSVEEFQGLSDPRSLRRELVWANTAWSLLAQRIGQVPIKDTGAITESITGARVRCRSLIQPSDSAAVTVVR